MERLAALHRHQARLRRCTRCPRMTGPPVVGNPVVSPVLLVGQAPGPKEIAAGRPFAWTAGKTLFGWFAKIGLDEASFRERVYMAAVCRCFPGKNPKGGDHAPDPGEIENCAPWLRREVKLLEPELVLPVGKLAISRWTACKKLTDVVGKVLRLDVCGVTADVIPLPHPSGASTWHRTEPGRTLLEHALRRVAQHPAWRGLVRA